MRNNCENNCLSCILKPLVQIGSLIGLSAVTIQCQHDQPQICRVDRSRILHFISACTASLLLCVGSMEIYDFFFVCSCDINNELDASSLIQRVIILCIGIFISCEVYKNKLAFNIIQIGMHALEYINSIGRHNFISKEKVYVAHRKIYISISTYTCLFALMCLYELIFVSFKAVLFPLAMFIWTSCHYFLYEIVMMEYLVVAELYEDIKKTIHYRIKYDILSKNAKPKWFSEEILKMIRMHKAAYFSCLELEDLLSPCSPISVMCQIATTVLVSFTTVVMIINQNFVMIFDKTYLINMFALFILGICAYLCLSACEVLGNSVRCCL